MKKMMYIASLAVYVAGVFLIAANHFWAGICVLGGGTTLISTLAAKNKTEREKEA
ncbi:hypothetical protein [Butyrivibrio sp. AD3002]|uniref:hypothetical protein n=1 Tax=Butyrivibrio sp. AD3002 TaxID=1280670 RepID=UPI0003B78D25|nr:hypothetical protein [Butyrivibrio sp. AD3002]